MGVRRETVARCKQEAEVIAVLSQSGLVHARSKHPTRKEFCSHAQSNRVVNINVKFSYTKDSCIKLNVTKLN